MKNVLITGLSGLLGSNLAFNFRDKYRVTGLYNAHKPFIAGIRALKVDLGEENIRGFVMDLRPEVIIHCAALTDVDYCEEHPKDAYRINAASTGKLAEAADKVGAKMVFISTDSVYKDVPDVRYKETSILGPLNVYSQTKKMGEELVTEACDDHVIVRTTIYGYNYQEKSSLAEWVVHNLEKGNEIKMFTDVFFNPILVNDLASVLDSAVSQGLRGVFNIDSEGRVSKFDFGVRLAAAFGLDASKIIPVSVEDSALKAPRPKNMVSDVSLVKEYVDIPTVDEGISRFKDLYAEGYHELLRKGE